MIMAMVAMIMMISSVSAQRIDNAYMEARVLTDKMAEELGLNNLLREKIYQLNIAYLNGINSYKDINAKVWKQRNSQLKSVLTSAQWKRYKNASYFYRPISWRNNAYVHNIYVKYPRPRPSFGGNRANKPVTLPMPKGQRPVEIGKPQRSNNTTYNKNNGKPSNNSNKSSNRNFGSRR